MKRIVLILSLALLSCGKEAQNVEPAFENPSQSQRSYDGTIDYSRALSIAENASNLFLEENTKGVAKIVSRS